ncbi:MAG: cobyrinate a,c-diamide synthase [Pseudomonadota bacterium]
MVKGLILAAPSSGAGKTVLTLGLLRAFARSGQPVRAAKSGPDYIDPAFHEAACGQPSVTLDAWAMAPDTLRALAWGGRAEETALLLIEGAMGALDAAADGRGSVAELAGSLGLPVILILDAAKAGQSVALAAAGFRALRPDLQLAGAILNRLASPRHAALARAGLAEAGVPVLGCVPRDAALMLPERHLGLVQAGEMPGLSGWLDRAADIVADAVDLAQLRRAAVPPLMGGPLRLLPPPGQRIALARDVAFSFVYPHLLAGWHAAGAELSFFSPLADEAPDPNADAVLLPGGYPELHAGDLAGATRFRAGLHAAAARGAKISGECGGYMVLGDGVVDAQGVRHGMLGLLPLETSFAERRLSLGYRLLTPCNARTQSGTPQVASSNQLAGHEFHYATVTAQGDAPPLYAARDAAGTDLGEIGMQRGSVSGSFAHVIGPAPG